MDDEDREHPEWTAPPEDEYDALNDETFGDVGDESAYTWEDSQAMFQELHKPTPDSKHSNGSSNGYSKNTIQMVETPTPVADARSKETGYFDYDNDNALEESISRLVLDDLEDEEEEEARKMKLSRLGAASNFNTYFMPPQVATKHLHWLMDKELPGGSSLLGSSVWSMHPTTTPDEPPIVHPPTPPSRIVQPPIMNTPILQPSRSNHLSNEDSFLAENNVSKFFGGVPASTPKTAPPAKKPVFKTVEEIERELLEDSPPTVTTNSVNDLTPIPHAKPKMLMAEDLERELIQESPMPTQKSQDFDLTPRSPLQPLTQLNQMFNADLPIPHQNQAQQKHPHQQQQQQQQQQPFPGLHSSSTANVGPAPNVHFNSLPGGPAVLNNNPALSNLLMMEQQKQIMLARQGLLPTPPHPVLHRGMHPSPIPPQLAQGFHHGLTPQQQQHLRMLQMNPHMRNHLPIILPIPPVMPRMRPHVLPHMGYAHPQQMASNYRKQMMKTDDPYRGLMNEKDKQRLRNIQIIQLQNDHPFTTDYYSLMYKVKHGGDSSKSNLLCKLYPRRDDENVHKNRYEPARFENSLGKLQAVSALAPKRVIDTVIRVTEARNTPRGGVKAYRYLLLEIEKLYECLLTMEEADIRVAILCNADDEDCLKRKKNEERIMKVLQVEDKLVNFLSVAKGKMLICRSLPLVANGVRYKVLGQILDLFPLWGSNEMHKAYPYLRHCILNTEIRDLLTIIGSVTDNSVYEAIAMTKLGISLLLCIFHQAEVLLAKCEPLLIEDLESLWTRKSVFAILAILVKNEELVEPIEVYTTILQHVRRYALHSTDFQVIESILQRWVNAGIPVRQ